MEDCGNGRNTMVVRSEFQLFRVGNRGINFFCVVCTNKISGFVIGMSCLLIYMFHVRNNLTDVEDTWGPHCKLLGESDSDVRRPVITSILSEKQISCFCFLFCDRYGIIR
jgi:hypothetical protein